MAYENAKESGSGLKEFRTRPGEKFNVSEDVASAYEDILKLAHPEGRLTYIPSANQIEKAKTVLYEKFMAENKGVEMSPDELFDNMDTLMSPL
jgi:hypothetical protein